jgi:exodeoxyribonuclease VII small subunit
LFKTGGKETSSSLKPAERKPGLDGRNGLSYAAGMSKPARADAGKGGLPFEEALKKLEGLVEAMESGDLPLETLLARYEEGTRLVKICQEKLAEAEL